MIKEEYEKIITSAINFASRILHIEENLVTYEVRNNGDNASYEDFKIKYRDVFLTSANELDIIAATLHEMRHCFQEIAVKYQSDLDEEIKEKWLYEMAHYIEPSGDINTDFKFLDQDIERDAFAFAYYIMKKIFNIELSYPKYLMDNILSKLDEFNKIY